MDKPNIILIMTDQHRGDALGCAGNAIIKTPHLDELANDGVFIPTAYTTTPSCTPARAGLLTGMNPWNHGMLGYAKVAKKYKYELPQMLRNAGYYTFGIGKMHWHPQRNLHGFHGTLLDESGRKELPGFKSDYRQWFKQVAPDEKPDATGISWNDNRWKDYALDEKLHPTHWTGETAITKIKEHNGNQPLFLKVSFARPHSPYDAPSRFVEQYNWEEMPAPFIGDWTEWHKKYRHIANPYFGDYGIEHAKRARRHYYASVTFIDEQIGKIIETLKDKNMYNNSIIIFTADHGDMLGDHHHWRKTYAYEGSARIPMILKWPESLKTEIKRGSILRNVVELRDILPTFLDICGEKIPTDMDGDSMLKLICNEKPQWREYIDLEHFTCYHWRNYWIALTDAKKKYIYFRSTGEEQLFDLEKDPKEETELSTNPNYTKQLDIWRERMVKHLEIRGKKWVKKGKLVKKKKGKLYSPNYPKYQ
jgi:arylsulfatase